MKRNAAITRDFILFGALLYAYSSLRARHSVRSVSACGMRGRGGTHPVMLAKISLMAMRTYGGTWTHTLIGDGVADPAASVQSVARLPHGLVLYM